MYEYALKGKKPFAFSFETAEDVFYPTDTSSLLIEGCRKVIRRPGKTLDLGCGVGVTGLVITKLGLSAEPLYASDISKAAVKLARRNAERLKVKIDARQGSLFEPWKDEQFDVIIDDISGISDEVAKVTPWFPAGVNCDAGRDGTRWILQVIKEAPAHLVKGGRLFFPVLSLSDEDKILKIAKKVFARVKLLAAREWFLPKATAENMTRILPLIEDGTIKCRNKFGAWLWTTKIFEAS